MVVGDTEVTTCVATVLEADVQRKGLKTLETFYQVQFRVVTKISRCRVNTTSRRGIKQLRVSFSSFFFSFPLKVAGEDVHSSRGKSPAPAS